MKTFIVKSTSAGSHFEAKTNDFDNALTYFDEQNKMGSITEVTDGETGKVLIQGEDGETTYIEPQTMLAMLKAIGEEDPEAGFLLGLLTLLSGALD